MARPRKCKMICGLPKVREFGPLIQPESSLDTVQNNEGLDTSLTKEDGLVMGLDEFETIRLIDLLDCTQEECAEQMGVARTTVQAVYNNARKKLAAALTEGQNLYISGGDYILCTHSGNCCKKNCSQRMGCGKKCGSAEQSCQARCHGECGRSMTT